MYLDRVYLDLVGSFFFLTFCNILLYMKSKLCHFGPGYTLFMCKSSQLACSQMLWSAESAGFPLDAFGSDSAV